MAYAQILVAVDLYPACHRVVQRAIEIADTESRLALLHVIDYLPPLSFADDFAPSPAVVIDEGDLMDRGKSALDKLAGELSLDEGIPRLVVLGSPKERIVRTAVERGADLIVIGSHGRHGLGRLLGSTATAVLNDAPCDVLAVRVGD
jgi:universal stress protein A